MRRLERLHAITNHLRASSPRTVPAAALAERFAVSRRTIERDLRSLHEAGVPIYGVEGRAGGYAVLPEHTMPPLRLSVQEAAACVAALTLLDSSPLEPHARTALDKLRSTLPAPVAAAGQLGERLLTIDSPGIRSSAAWLDAIQGRVLVRLTYSDGEDPRLVEPYTTLQADGRWYLIGWCRTKDAVRGFRTDRIRDLETTTEVFTPTRSAAVAADLARWRPRPLT